MSTNTTGLPAVATASNSSCWPCESFSEDRDAAAQVQALAGRIPDMRGVYAGRLRNAGQVEALTANLIAINRRYKTHAGIRVTDL